MPNNVSILAYIQAMKDRNNENIKNAENVERNGGKMTVSNAGRSFLQDLCNLEKFIKGGK